MLERIFLMRERIIFFDGVCNLCDGLVQFILKRDKNKIFKFSSLQSNFAQKKIAEFGENAQNLNAIFYLKDEKLFSQSQAVLEIAKDLGFPYRIISVFQVFPHSFRDFLYQRVAKNRYKLFGQKNECMLPTPELKNRFLD
ncbi:DUF393 domain-containing protein [Ornithobacterium rhinotracheale]|nr:DUF393 domain-containing protein [Ornithobacterium rhinotracheale]